MELTKQSEATSTPPNRWRFSLGGLMLATALGLAVLANFLQFRANQQKVNEIWQYHQRVSGRYGGDLHSLLQNHLEFDKFAADDQRKINVSLVPGSSTDEWLWQIGLPHGNYKVCMASSDIPAEGFPVQQGVSYKVHRSTWLKLSLGKNPDKNFGPTSTIAYQSFQPHLQPSLMRNSGPHHYHGADPYDQFHLWSVTGRERRESFSLDGPVELLRLRELARSAGEDADLPCRGILLWIQKEP